MRSEYGPKPRIVVELTEPVVLGVYVNGEPVDVPVTLSFKDGRGSISVVFAEGSHPVLNGRGVGYQPDIEVMFQKAERAEE